MANLKKTKARFSQSVSDKQDFLVSGTNIKTVNGQSLIGPGNVDVSSERLSSYTSPYLYLGYAPLGSTTAEEVWTITRVEVLLDGSADSEEATLVAWDDRLTAIYV